jgi:hypothetical protein
MFGEVDLPATMSFSLGVQQRVKSIVVEAAYVGGLSRHQYAYSTVNAIPMYARRAPAAQDPTRPGSVLLDDFLRPYRGYTTMNIATPQLSTNYNSLQVSANRRFSSGLQFGLAYTFSKALGVSAFALNPYFDFRHYEYGPLSFDRSQTLFFNYIYDLPKLGAKLNSKPVGWVLDNWSVSGITSFISGSPYSPSFSTTDGADITGSQIGARIDVVGDPNLSKSEKTFDRTFNTDVFRRPAKDSFGNSGTNILRGPGVNNWDIAVSKRFPLWSEERTLMFRSEFFNAWNHTQFSGVNSSARFDPAGKQTNLLFGSYSSSRSPRIIQFSLKLTF